jgi:hypothetical protein
MLVVRGSTARGSRARAGVLLEDGEGIGGGTGALHQRVAARWKDLSLRKRRESS